MLLKIQEKGRFFLFRVIRACVLGLVLLRRTQNKPIKAALFVPSCFDLFIFFLRTVFVHFYVWRFENLIVMDLDHVDDDDNNAEGSKATNVPPSSLHVCRKEEK